MRSLFLSSHLIYSLFQGHITLLCCQSEKYHLSQTHTLHNIYFFKKKKFNTISRITKSVYSYSFLDCSNVVVLSPVLHTLFFFSKCRGIFLWKHKNAEEKGWILSIFISQILFIQLLGAAVLIHYGLSFLLKLEWI